MIYLGLVCCRRLYRRRGLKSLDVYKRQVETLINLRHGVGDVANDLPQRLKDEPMPDGYAKGQVWERDVLIQEYYKERGWNEKGVPLPQTLKRLGLEGAVKEFWD